MFAFGAALRNYGREDYAVLVPWVGTEVPRTLLLGTWVNKGREKGGVGYETRPPFSQAAT
jgi:hypothetical protein